MRITATETKVPYTFSDPNNVQVKTIGPPSVMLSQVFSGDKTFSRFQKGGLPPLKLKPPVPLPTPIKCKVKTIGPLSGSAQQSPSGG